MKTFKSPHLRLMACGLLVLTMALSSQTAARPAWEADDVAFAVDPINRRGGNPSYANAPWNPNLGTTGGRLEDDGGALSGNYQLSIPLVGFPGRGQNMQLGMHYSAQLWSQLSSGMAFDPDGDWPSPGWSIGFGRILRAGSGVLIGPDNTRRSLHAMNPIGGRVAHLGIDGDSLAHIEICCFAPNGGDGGRKATLTDGRGGRVDYFTPTPGDRNAIYYPSRLVDANGNYVSITYMQDSAGKAAPPAIDHVTDTVGRQIRFHYDANQRLVSISAPGLDSERRVYARFIYWKRAVRVDLGEHCDKSHDGWFDGIYGVVLPGTGTGYWLPPSSNYGISTQLYETTGVRLDAPSLNAEAKVVSEGTQTRRTEFDYPNGATTTCIEKPPSYASKTEEWADPVSGDRKTAVTRYSRTENGDDTVMVVTRPDQSISRQYIARRTDAAKFTVAGQVRRVENADAAGAVLSSTDFEWQADTPESYGAPRQRAVIENIDPLGRGKRTAFQYDDGWRKPFLPAGEWHYAYHGVSGVADIEWFSETTYARDAAHVDARLFGLPRSVRRFIGNPFNAALVSRTDFEYDQAPLEPVGVLGQHLQAYEPHTVKRCARQKIDTSTGRPRRRCVQYKDVPAKVVTIRGNLTRITRFADAGAGASPVSTHLRYDTAGNVVKSFDDTGSGTQVAYDAASSLSLPSRVSSGAMDPSSPLRVTSSFEHYLGAGLPRSTTDPDGRVTRLFYQAGPSGWRTQLVELPDGTKQKHVFDDVSMAVNSHIEDASGKAYSPTSLRFDGRGQLRRRTVSMGVISTVDTEYDSIGRVVGQSQPYEPLQTPLWTKTGYDALGRAISRTSSNGEAFIAYAYDEPRPLPMGVPALPLQGSTVRATDAWGREKWMQRDSAGNLKYVVEPRPDGTADIFAAGNLLTEYRIDPFGRLQDITMGPQKRRFAYDGLGRLKGQALPEREASLDALGVYQGTGSPEKYSDVFFYDSRSNLVASVDARGVRTVHDYRGDPLNRLQEVRYEIPSQVDPASQILPAASVSLSYAQGGDLRRPAGAEVQGLVKQTMQYDAQGRPMKFSTELKAYPASPFTVSLAYDDIGRIKAVTYPARYGSGGAERTLGRAYEGDQPSALTLEGNPLVSGLAFFPDGRTKELHLETGAGRIKETFCVDPVKEPFCVDPVLGLPSGQSATDANGASLLRLQYRYRRQAMELAGRTEMPGIVGSITAVRDLDNNDLTQDFGYDRLGRLTGSSVGDEMQVRFDPMKVSWQQYSYDRFGNRTNVRAFRQVVGRNPCPVFPCTTDLDEEDHDGVSRQAFDPGTNRITSAGYAYDAAGNLIRGQALINGVYEPRSYQYDAAGRLAQVSAGVNGPLIEAYKYGADHRRLGASPDGAYWDYFVWLGEKNIAKFASLTPLAPPVWTEDTYYLGERRIASERPENNGVSTRYHLADHRGTGLTVLARNGAVQAARQGGRPFGTESVSTREWLDTRRFTSYDRAGPTGLDNAVNRQYSAGLGRFLQTDPIGSGAFSLGDPQSLNAYSYVANDPINLIDPDGLKRKVSRICSGKFETCIHDYTDFGPQASSPTSLVINLGASSTGPGLVNAGITPAVENENPKSFQVCRENYLNKNYSQYGATAIRYLSPLEAVIDTKAYIESILENAAIKGGLFKLIPIGLEAAAAMNTLEAGRTIIEREELLAEAAFDINAANAIRSSAKYVAGSLLLIGEFAAIQDAGAFISCSGVLDGLPNNNHGVDNPVPGRRY